MDKRIKNSLIIGTFLLILTIIFLGYYVAQEPRNQIRNNAYKLSQKYAKMNKMDNFYIFNRNNRIYYSVAGQNTSGKPVYFIISKDGKDTTTIPQSKGISANEANNLVWNKRSPQKVLDISLGYYKKELVWDIVYFNKKHQLSYTLLKFKDGQTVKTIENVN